MRVMNFPRFLIIHMTNSRDNTERLLKTVRQFESYMSKKIFDFETWSGIYFFTDCTNFFKKFLQ